jgi:uncharacterized membrane protein
MRVVGRYFSIGATLGSVSGLVALLLIWGWMTIHLGVLGFAFGWIPAGLAAGLLWLTMVVFWAPVLIIGTIAAAALVMLTHHGRHGKAWEEPPAATTPEERLAPAPEEEEPRTLGTEPEAPASPAAREVEAEPPPPATPLPPIGLAPGSLGEPPASGAPPPASAAPPAEANPQQRPSDDLGSDAAAAGDTSRKPRR